MHKVLILGAGKIGSLVACLLGQTNDFTVCLADKNFNGADVKRLLSVIKNLQTIQLDIDDQQALVKYLTATPYEIIISCLPYYCNPSLAKLAKQFNLHYFDLTEDVQVTRTIAELAKDATTAFVPQCGLAPGFISIVAHDLMTGFENIDSVQLRVGALPLDTNNALQYALTWSTDGLINEYGNLCVGIENGNLINLAPLEGLEKVEIDGLIYEAFNTSGGLGSLAESYLGRVKTMNYKTLRYPGHCEKMRFLMFDLKLNESRPVLKNILENVLPKTYQDVVVIYVSVIGRRHSELFEKNYVKKLYPQMIANLNWSAIQVTTATSVCAIVDMVAAEATKYRGLILQEQFSLTSFLTNRFGKYYN